ncbi:MAG: hypothetical protein A3C06_01870 [Candidatus Taylorbacteria bacterium RIFCSPHIGHO2_02_FULL_46_13]|uniref:Uncharacterized protein n=1 Tax=Candidatus Taylorbacteria bacterium RIFCSPHIGHO2_02_FULL_46_13 TaxID=1802312 RepID=A0A1G2MSH2_9BACT|nr:MAG: hypothetical protein A3C06_01870 [Candidatus Taylorbacteria bacterium RIFCSPHIGHO2_02_FULL_46_13]
MLPNIPATLNVDVIFRLHEWMIDHDPLHSYYTWLRFGANHEPTHEERCQHWFERGAATFEQTIVQIAHTHAS